VEPTAERALKVLAFIFTFVGLLHVLEKAWKSPKRPWTTVALIAGLITALAAQMASF
jgi:hypothetical protein